MKCTRGSEGKERTLRRSGQALRAGTILKWTFEKQKGKTRNGAICRLIWGKWRAPENMVMKWYIDLSVKW
jgi:hypothetical protein